MKKNYLLLFVKLLLLITFKDAASQFDDNRQVIIDHSYYGNRNVTVKMTALSTPFQGYTNAHSQSQIVDSAQSGSYQLRNYNCSSGTCQLIAPIIFYEQTTDTYPFGVGDFRFSSVTAIPNSVRYTPGVPYEQTHIQNLFGFGKYRFDFVMNSGPYTGKHFFWTIDYSDSKYGKLNFFPAALPGMVDKHYITRLIFIFMEEGAGNKMLVKRVRREVDFINSQNDTTWQYTVLEPAIDTVYENTLKNFDIWEITTRGSAYHTYEPYGENFTINSIPFPLSRTVASDTLRQIEFHTKAKLAPILNPANSPNSDNIYFQNFTDGKTTVTPGVYVTQNGQGMGSKIILNSQSELTISDEMNLKVVNLDTLEIKDNSKIYLGASASLSTGYLSVPGNDIKDVESFQIGFNEYGTLILENCELNGTDSSSRLSLINKGKLAVTGYAKLNNVKFETDSTTKIEIHDNAILELAGSYASADLQNLSNHIKLGANAKIVIKNGANFKAQDVVFENMNTNLWEGIVLENAGEQTQIKNSTFTNAKTSIRIANTSTVTANLNKVIEFNTINIPSNGNYGIYADNINKLLVNGNQFTGGSSTGKVALYVRHPANSGNISAGPSSEPVYSLNVTNNYFNNTGHGMILAGYTSAQVPYYIYNNTGTVANYGIIGRKISGGIKNNSITSSNGIGVLVHQSINTFFDNDFIAKNTALTVLAGATPRLAPLFHDIDGLNLAWDAGLNLFKSTDMSSIRLNYGSIILDLGQNTFNKGSVVNPSFHLMGNLSGTGTLLAAQNNCWEPSGPVNSVVNDNWQQVSVITTTSGTFQCRVISPSSVVVTNMGNGTYDTVFIADNPSGTIPAQDAVLYGMGVNEMGNQEYVDAISAFKSLITEDTESSYLESAVYDLYTCHQYLDTSGIEIERDMLYSSLKNYLEDRINNVEYPDEFITAAYDVILMCDMNIKHYQAAADGYEFLSLYHPSPETRLMSSEDLAIVEDLVEGEGGSYGSAENTYKNIKAKIEKLISNDPIIGKVKKSFDNVIAEKKLNTEKDIQTGDRLKKEQMMANEKKFAVKIDERVRENLTLMRTLSKEEKEKRHYESLMMLGSLTGTEENDININIPLHYTLSQNYPNPFNPVTTISYGLPKDGLMKLKVYDITGREVMTLVNDFKAAGSYQVQFDGSGFSSGVYFYRIEAGSFIETRRMVLVK